MSEEKIKKAELSVFFLIGPHSSSSGDSSTEEYSEHALNIVASNPVVKGFLYPFSQ